MITIVSYLLLATSHPATTYGFNEIMCGDIGSPRACAYGATTASGEAFNPLIPSIAIPAPTKLRMKSFYIRIRDSYGRCKPVLVNDKKNPRYIGRGGLDLSPAAQELVTGKKPSKNWSGYISICHESSSFSRVRR